MKNAPASDIRLCNTLTEQTFELSIVSITVLKFCKEHSGLWCGVRCLQTKLTADQEHNINCLLVEQR